ncbi:HAUS augmin-like complex subunit 3 [Sceloporus undulatus]|uniref:HAUS augmin-like complex subunit 3 n=1 Tax=Sceloporus undulatus TaxID=8520 RepID=UPI001C4BA0F2|nr:HAUS augmin-like complex subunit 3 [Sceloporus undulatus]
MFARRHSRQFLLDTVDRGAEFVEILKTIYPKAGCLHQEDFDWLFDCPQTEQFLEWFCNTVGEENVLDSNELENYEKLVISGKPVLEGEALEEVLKIYPQSSELKGAPQENEAMSLETLKQEMQSLKSQRTCCIKRHNKLQACLGSLKQEICCSIKKKEKGIKELEKTHLKLELENYQSNDVLSQVCKTAKELFQWHTDPGNERMRTSMATADLRHYLESEETTTKAFSGYLSKIMPSIIHDMEANKIVLVKKQQGSTWEDLDTDTIARLAQGGLLQDMSITSKEEPEDHTTITTSVLKSHVLAEGQLARKNEAKFSQKALSEEMDKPKTEGFRSWGLAQNSCQGGLKETKVDEKEHSEGNNLDTYQEELGRMELAYMQSQMAVVMTSAKVKGISSSLQWAVKALKTVKEKKVEEDKGKLCLHIANCQEQLCILQTEVEQAKMQQLVPLLQGSARLLRLPIVSGELDLETFRLERLELMQEEAASQTVGHLSHLELLRFLLVLEKKNLQQMGTLLKEMLMIRNGLFSKLQDWQSCFEDSRFSIKQCPRTLIDPSDFTTLRLWEMLDKHSQEKQLFHSYETLASRASRLWQQLRMLQVQLATPLTQLPKLESENKVLHCLMYGDSKQLMLHAQELSEPLEQLSITHAKLYQMLMDTLSDLKVKRKSLQSHFQKIERSLYMHFFKNPDHLKELVEEAEKQTMASSYV